MARKIWMTAAMALFLMLGAGCQTTPLNISIQLDQSFRDKVGPNRPILVDVIGVKDADNAKWENQSMTEYFANPDDKSGPRANDQKITLAFNSDSLQPQVISANDKMWASWLATASSQQPTRIYVLVQMPGTHIGDDKPGAQDSRRAILSTLQSAYKRGLFDPPPTVHLVIGSTGIHQE